MTEITDRIAGEVLDEATRLRTEADALQAVYDILKPIQPPIAQTNSAPAKKARKGKRRGRPTDAAKAKELGVSLEDFKAMKKAGTLPGA